MGIQRLNKSKLKKKKKQKNVPLKTKLKNYTKPQLNYMSYDFSYNIFCKVER